jgi:hypothetical protein
MVPGRHARQPAEHPDVIPGRPLGPNPEPKNTGLAD